jgi:hypothetical protein
VGGHTRVVASSRKLWLDWVGHTTLGYLLRVLIVTAAPLPGSRDLALAPVVGALSMGAVALLQWRVLRRYLLGLRWWSWVLATIVGQLVATIVVIVAAAGALALGAGLVDPMDISALPLLTAVVLGGLLGAVIGLAQWLTLRRYVRAASWWILAAFVAGAATASVPLMPDLGIGLGRTEPLLRTQLMSALIVGAITGMALIWLLQQRQEGGQRREGRVA